MDETFSMNKLKGLSVLLLFFLSWISLYWLTGYKTPWYYFSEYDNAKGISFHLGDIAVENYDIIFLGYPNWWDTMPMTVWTFLETYDFGGKTIIPFCTHEGSRMGRSEQDIKTLCPKATVMKGLPIKGSNVQNADKEIEKWVLSNK